MLVQYRDYCPVTSGYKGRWQEPFVEVCVRHLYGPIEWMPIGRAAHLFQQDNRSIHGLVQSLAPWADQPLTSGRNML